MYLQILAETGLLGVSLFLLVIGIAFFKGLSVLAATHHDKQLFNWAFVAAALVGAPLAHGLGEASTITGAACASILLAFGFALLDRLPEMARERASAANLQNEWDAYHEQMADEYTAHPA